jgi:hypothetical protein
MALSINMGRQYSVVRTHENCRRRSGPHRCEDSLVVRVTLTGGRALHREVIGHAEALLFVIGGVCGLKNPKRFAVVRDLHWLSCLRHALDFARFADQRAERNRCHTVRH